MSHVIFLLWPATHAICSEAIPVLQMKTAARLHRRSAGDRVLLHDADQHPRETNALRHHTSGEPFELNFVLREQASGGNYSTAVSEAHLIAVAKPGWRCIAGV